MTDLNQGHGHVFRRADGVKARCGGPGMCSECSADLARLAAAAKRPQSNEGFEADLEADLQAMCQRALDGT